MPRGIRTNQVKKGFVKKAKDGTNRGRPKKLIDTETERAMRGVIPSDQQKELGLSLNEKRKLALLDQLQDCNLDVVQELVQYYRFQADDKTQLKILLKLLDYCFPKLRAQEFNVSEEQKVVFNLAMGNQLLNKKEAKNKMREINPSTDEEGDSNILDINNEE